MDGNRVEVVLPAQLLKFGDAGWSGRRSAPHARAAGEDLQSVAPDISCCLGRTVDTSRSWGVGPDPVLKAAHRALGPRPQPMRRCTGFHGSLPDAVGREWAGLPQVLPGAGKHPRFESGERASGPGLETDASHRTNLRSRTLPQPLWLDLLNPDRYRLCASRPERLRELAGALLWAAT